MKMSWRKIHAMKIDDFWLGSKVTKMSLRNSYVMRSAMWFCEKQNSRFDLEWR